MLNSHINFCQDFTTTNFTAEINVQKLILMINMGNLNNEHLCANGIICICSGKNSRNILSFFYLFYLYIYPPE